MVLPHASSERSLLLYPKPGTERAYRWAQARSGGSLLAMRLARAATPGKALVT